MATSGLAVRYGSQHTTRRESPMPLILMLWAGSQDCNVRFHGVRVVHREHVAEGRLRPQAIRLRCPHAPYLRSAAEPGWTLSAAAPLARIEVVLTNSGKHWKTLRVEVPVWWHSHCPRQGNLQGGRLCGMQFKVQRIGTALTGGAWGAIWRSGGRGGGFASSLENCSTPACPVSGR